MGNVRTEAKYASYSTEELENMLRELRGEQKRRETQKEVQEIVVKCRNVFLADSYEDTTWAITELKEVLDRSFRF